MSNEPIMNQVAFQLNGGQVVTGDAPAQAEDSIRKAWWKVIREHCAKARDVTGIFSTWAPSEGDDQFIRRAFPNLTETKSLVARPDPDGWEQSAAMVDKIMEQAGQLVAEEELKTRAGQLAEDLPRVQQEGVLLPILRSFSVEGMFGTERELIPDKLWFRLARVAMTPRGTVGQSSVSPAELENTTFDELLEQACANLREGLGGKVGQDDGKNGALLYMEREGHQGASALVLPDFHEWVSGILGTDLLIVGLACEDHLNIAGADSDWLEEIVEMVACHDHDSGVSRYVLLVDGSGMRVVAEFEAPDPDGWRRALPQIRQAIDEYRRSEAQQRRQAPVDVLAPVLLSAVSPPPSTPSHPVVPGRLHVLLARSTRTPEGTVALDHVTDETLGDTSFDKQLHDAYITALMSLRDNRVGIELGGNRYTLVTLTAQESYLAASAVALPDFFYTAFSNHLETDRLFAGFTNHDRLYIAAADCGLENFKIMSHFSEPSAPDLAATILLFEPDGVQIVAARPAR